jgi:hypothetical protein
MSFSALFPKVYGINLVGHTAKRRITLIATIGLIPKSTDKDIIGGANNTPSKLKI